MPDAGMPDAGPADVTAREADHPGPAQADVAAPGGSAIYWAAVAAMAADLAGRGRVLPVLEAEDAGYAARWRPVLGGSDAQRARDLAAAMPPLCRAAQPAGEPPAPVFAAALDALCDGAVRARLDRDQAGWTSSARRGRRPAQIGVAERWAQALTGADARVAITSAEDAADAKELASALAGWRGAAQAPAPVRTCFRLVEPEAVEAPAEPAVDDGLTEPPRRDAAEAPAGDGDEATAERGRWRVEFALQSTDDPSLMIAAEDIWTGTAGLPVGGIKHPEEELLAGLGTAARLFPELDAELRHAAPATATLDTAGAFRFLKETGPLLSGAGFGVLLPDWARKARLGLKLTSRSSSAGSAGGSVKRRGVRPERSVPVPLRPGCRRPGPGPRRAGRTRPAEDPLVRIRGQWVELTSGNLKAAMRFLERGQAGHDAGRDALLAGLRGPEDDLPVTGVDADGWLGDLLSGEPTAGSRPSRLPILPRHPAPLPRARRGLAVVPQQPGDGRNPRG